MAVNIFLVKNYIRHFFTAKRKGHDVHSPFAYSLCEEVFYNKASFYDFEKLDKIRNQLLRNKTIIEVEDFGAGSRVLKGNTRKIADIAAKGISSRKQSEIIYKMINYLRPRKIIELGTSIGLNTLYLAMANQSSEIYTIEGSAKLSAFAKTLAGKNQVSNIEFLSGKFDDLLPPLLKKTESFEMIYIDGNHTYESTMHYFRLALEAKEETSVFIFDDIYWSKGMTKAWKEIILHPEVRMSIDCFWFGFVFFRKEIKEPVRLSFFI